MSDDLTSKDVLMLHDRRLTEQDNKIHDAQTGIKSIEHELRQLFERINQGVSPTQQKILVETSEIKVQIKDLEHKVDLNMLKMDDTIRSALEKSKDYIDHEIQSLPGKYLTKDDDFIRNLHNLTWGVAASLFLILILAAYKYVFDKKQNFESDPVGVHTSIRRRN